MPRNLDKSEFHLWIRIRIHSKCKLRIRIHNTAPFYAISLTIGFTTLLLSTPFLFKYRIQKLLLSTPLSLNSLHVLYGGLGVSTSNCNSCSKKREKNFSCISSSSIFAINTLDPDPQHCSFLRHFFNYRIHLKSGRLLGDGEGGQSITYWMRANATLVCHLPLTFFFLFLLQLLSIKTLDPDPHSLKMLDPDRQHWSSLCHFWIHNTTTT
jgi:hypothetical protein